MRRGGIPTAVLLSWSMAASAPAQEPAASSVQEAASASSAVTADEDFELNITDRRITEENFEASVAVEIRTGQSEEQGLAVRVGARVGARRIDVRLRNVRGHVRFVASLEEVQEVIDSHRSEAAAR
jgi:hypothetical protein